MKLRFLSFLFSWSAGLCRLTALANRAAGRLHMRCWDACTAENLRTCNTRRADHDRFN
jgi:hypothetical protein